MSLSKSLDSKTGYASSTEQKQIPATSENCPSPNNCQYWAGTVCALEECPFRSPRELNGANTMNADGTQNYNNATRSCFICGTTFKGFIGAVPICSNCITKIKYVIATPHCPGCGTVVSTPHKICANCDADYRKDTY